MSRSQNVKIPAGLSKEEAVAFEAAALKTAGGFWPSKDPQEGEYYIGNFVTVAEVPNTLGKKGEMQNLYTFQNDSVTTKMYGTYVLDQELSALDLSVGDRVLILYKGRAAKGKGKRKPVKLFAATRVDVKRSKR